MRCLPCVVAQSDDGQRFWDGLQQGDAKSWIILGIIVAVFLAIFVIKAMQPD